MALPIVFSLLFCLAAASPMPQTQHVPAGQCCFGLQDSGSSAILQQDRRNGDVYLKSTFTNGWFCTEPSTNRKLLFDDENNTCFTNPSGQFICFDPIPSGDQWTLEKQGSSRLLARDGSVDFWACPNKAGGEILFVQGKKDKTGCRKLNLKAHTLKGACS
ncbi:hypothetical protein HJFPF1_03752 [Paramyrothecium foliicola]|nr:hypothetical protein HJFPF1_03752 [Paramyrothecium foliicola]